MYPKGSPKFNLVQAARGRKGVLGAKKDSPKITRNSPKVLKPRAQWNLALEKSLVEILHEHDTTYYRGQNGWNAETWNRMVKIFHARHNYVKFTKNQIQDKEKEMKREYRMIKELRKQSGVGWDDIRCMIQADAHLWDNLTISFGSRINKFKSKPFPLFDMLGELYDGHTAEGHYNFTSNAEPSQSADLTQIGSETEVEAVEPSDDELQLVQEVDTVQRVEVEQVNRSRAGLERVNRSRADVEHERVNPSRAEVELEQVNQTMDAGGSRKNPQKEVKKAKKSPKKSSGDAMVGVMQRYVELKEKQAKDEVEFREKHAKDEVAMDFSITRCMTVLKTMRGITTAEKVKAFDVFKLAENREIFMNAAADEDGTNEDGTARMWLQSQIAKLP